MTELVRLYLNAGRLERFRRDSLVQAGLVLLAFGGLCLAVVFLEHMGSVGGIVLLALSTAASIASMVSVALQRRYTFTLCDAQYADDQSTASEEARVVSERYYRRLLVLKGEESGPLQWIATILQYAALIAGSVSSALYLYNVIGSEGYIYCLLGVTAAVFLGFVLRIVLAMQMESACSLFRVEMRREIAFYRARAARDGVRVSQSTSSVLPVDHFLTDDLRVEYRLLQKRSDVSMIGWMIAFVLLFASGLNDMAPMAALVLGCIFAALVLFLIVRMVQLQRRINALWKANERSFTESEQDELRKDLQNGYLRLQRRGNMIFLSAIVLAVVGAIAMTAVGYGLGEVDAVSLWENFAGTAFLLLLVFAVAAFVIWVIMYAMYRRRVSPVEKRLSEMNATEKQV